MTGRGRGARAAMAAAVTAVALAHGGCGEDARELFVRPLDGGVDGDAPRRDAEPELDPTLGGPCTEAAQCDDGVPCTYDSCDGALSRCRNVPDDAQCDDGVFCNGKEACVPRRGCATGPVVTCQDGDPCTIDTCVEDGKACLHATRDVDGDQDPDDHCVGRRDCDDTDPLVSSRSSEVCGNGKDDDCDGQLDEPGCSQPTNDVCATARTIAASGTYLLTSVAARKDYATSCSLAAPAAARDIVVAIQVPPGDAEDVHVWATAHASSNEVALALQQTCGDSASELACGHVDAASDARAIARAVPGGSTVHAIVTTKGEGEVSLEVALAPPLPRPANETCESALDVSLDAPFTVSIVDPARDLASACDEARTGELTYAFTLAEPQDVRVFASTLAGSGAPVVTLRDGDGASCASELRCRTGTTPALFARSLPPGRHVLSVAGTTQIDASVLVKAYPPTTPPATGSCATAPPLVPNVATAVDLASHEDAIKGGCLAGGIAAAYGLELTEKSDVLVVGRFPLGATGSVWLTDAACATLDPGACAMGETPVRVSKRNLDPGSYRVVVADLLGQPAQLSVFVRPTVAPVAIAGSDGCAGTLAVPATGGYFTGDTTALGADFDASCDAPGVPLGGAKDQLLRLDVAERRRVVLDMIGSQHTTLLDVRRGAACPGVEVPNACNVGFGASRSFVEAVLDPGTYWLQVDGYAADAGPWNLDVRVLPP